MGVNLEPIIAPEDRASILESLTRIHETPPLETPPAETPPAETPAPTPPPEQETDPEGARGDAVDAILKSQEATLSRLDDLIAGLSADKGVTAPTDQAGRTEALEELMEVSPEARGLVEALGRAQAQIESLGKRLDARDAAEQQAIAVEQQTQRIADEARALLTTHDLKPADIDKVLGWMADPKNAGLAGTLTFRESAGRALGYDYVEAQRRTPGATTTPPGAAGAGAKTAKILTDTAPGPGAGSPAGAAPAQGVGGDDLRSACNEILRTSGHLLGKHK